jgi:hypothetical protein
MQPFPIGIIGAGNISGIYLQNAARFGYRVLALADLDLARAQAKASEHGVALACGVDELLARPDIVLVLNLTVPAAHASISTAALQAGKHVYGEKPLAATLAEGQALVAVPPTPFWVRAISRPVSCWRRSARRFMPPPPCSATARRAGTPTRSSFFSPVQGRSLIWGRIT